MDMLGRVLNDDKTAEQNLPSISLVDGGFRGLRKGGRCGKKKKVGLSSGSR